MYIPGAKGGFNPALDENPNYTTVQICIYMKIAVINEDSAEMAQPNSGIHTLSCKSWFIDIEKKNMGSSSTSAPWIRTTSKETQGIEGERGGKKKRGEDMRKT